MRIYSREYDEENDEFVGAIEAYLVNTEKENLKNWLASETTNSELVYNSIKELTNEILIIKNAYIEEEYRGNGFGIDMVNDVISDSYATSSILLCDLHENQKNGFNLEKFYNELGFCSVLENSTGNPLMIYPESLALKIKEKLEKQPSLKVKI